MTDEDDGAGFPRNHRMNPHPGPVSLGYVAMSDVAGLVGQSVLGG
jgi:hypothetical protein